MPLTDHFRKQFAKHHQKSVRGVSPVVTRKFFAYDWPGNVRQLRNAVETMVVLDADGVLDVDDLPPELVDVEEAPVAAEPGPTRLIGQTMDEIEKWAIEQTLTLTNGNREETARILGIGARTLYRKLDKYGFENGGQRPSRACLVGDRHFSMANSSRGHPALQSEQVEDPRHWRAY